jgi:hypothetical protein
MELCTALANAAQFRVERGEPARAETLLRKAIEIAERIGSYNDRFFAWVHLAHFMEEHGRDTECEQAFRNAIESVPLFSFNLRHAIALKELGAVVMRNGRPEEGLALQCLSLKVFEALSEDLCLETIQKEQAS